MRIKIEVLDQGDEAIGFSENRLAIRKIGGEVEIITLTFDDNNIPRISDRSVLITFKTSSVPKASISDESGKFEIGSF